MTRKRRVLRDVLANNVAYLLATPVSNLAVVRRLAPSAVRGGLGRDRLTRGDDGVILQRLATDTARG